MPIDTSRTLEIEASPWKMLLLTVMALGMTALSGVIVFWLIGDMPTGNSIHLIAYAGMLLIGCAGVLFFGLCAGVALWRMISGRGPVVTIAPHGIRDTRVAAEFVPWRAVRGISTWRSHGQTVMVLAVDPAAERQLTLTTMAKWTRGANRALGADGLCITAQGLKMDYGTLLKTSMAYARAAAG